MLDELINEINAVEALESQTNVSTPNAFIAPQDNLEVANIYNNTVLSDLPVYIDSNHPFQQAWVQHS